MRKGESPAEADLYQGTLLLSQGMILEAWHVWATVAQGGDDPLAASQGDTAWRLLFESYFKHGNQDNTLRFLQEITPIEPTAQQNRLLQELLGQQSPARLQELAQMQPPTSALLPLFQSALAMQPPWTGSVETSSHMGGDSSPPGGTPSALPQAANEAAAPALKIGLLLPLGGKSASMGEHLRRATKKALADYANMPIQLSMADSGDSADSVRKGINDLLAQHVDVVVGPVFYATVQPAVEVAVAHQIPIITLNPQREGDTALPGVFSNALQPEQQAKIMARHAVLDKKYARIAVLAPESEYGRGVSKTFGDEVRVLGGNVQRVSYFPPETVDFSPWLKGEGASFDALFLPAPAKQVRLIAPQLANVRMGKAPVALLGTALWNSAELLSSGPEYLEGAIFCDIDSVAKEQFRQSFRQTWEEDPTPLATLAYDGVAVLAQLLQAQLQGGPAWREGLTRANGFQGAVGPVRFLENGRSRRLYHLFQVNKGQIQRLQPLPDSLNIP
ncbi:MAG: penicillin-binding protein activator [Magnetococcales bacterium]|nr:penicillin-binding protein activator [Magnetococcales bacterium]